MFTSGPDRLLEPVSRYPTVILWQADRRLTVTTVKVIGGLPVFNLYLRALHRTTLQRGRYYPVG